MRERLVRFKGFAREGFKKRGRFVGKRLGQWPGWFAFLKSCWRMSRHQTAGPVRVPPVLLVTDPKWKNLVYSGPMRNFAKEGHENRERKE